MSGSLPYDERVISAVDKVSSSVVSVSTVHLIRDHFLHIHPISGMGSGLIIDDGGYVVTNSHVVSGSERMTVATMDGSDLKSMEDLQKKRVGDKIRLEALREGWRYGVEVTLGQVPQP